MIFISNYINGKVSYLHDNIPCEMQVDEEMVRESFAFTGKMFPFVLGLRDNELIILISKYHSEKNRIVRNVDHRDLYLDYRTM